MKKLLSIVVLGLLLGGNAYSESWDVIDIPDKGIKQGDKAWPLAREQAISLCRQKNKFANLFFCLHKLIACSRANGQALSPCFIPLSGMSITSQLSE